MPSLPEGSRGARPARDEKKAGAETKPAKKGGASAERSANSARRQSRRRRRRPSASAGGASVNPGSRRQRWGQPEQELRAVTRSRRRNVDAFKKGIAWRTPRVDPSMPPFGTTSDGRRRRWPSTLPSISPPQPAGQAQAPALAAAARRLRPREHRVRSTRAVPPRPTVPGLDEQLRSSRTAGARRGNDQPAGHRADQSAARRPRARRFPVDPAGRHRHRDAGARRDVRRSATSS